MLLYFRALSKRDELLGSAYDAFVRDDAHIVRGVANVYELQEIWKRCAPQAYIAQFYSLLQPV